MSVKKVLFLGSKLLGLNVLMTIQQLAPEKLVGVISPNDTSDDRSAIGEFESYLNECSVPFHVVKTASEAEAIIGDYSPDLVIVVGWYWLINSKILDSVPYGFIGVHNSLLPKYRGFSPLVWQIINGEDRVGFSVFSLTAGMDTGEIWFQDSIAITKDESVASILGRLETRIVSGIEILYPKILQGLAQPEPQDDVAVSYCSNRLPCDGLIDWNLPAQKINDFIRAQSSPYPCAYTRLNGTVIRINRAQVMPYAYYGTPGQVIEIAASGVTIACGDNRAVKVTEILGESSSPESFRTVFKSIKSRLD